MTAEPSVHPCHEHQSILSSDLPWHRAVDIADECESCEVIG